jgi:RimJ/RimL family protein N-acetyltransferase
MKGLESESRSGQQVALSIGFVREAILRERIVFQERPHDCVLFSQLKSEFKK